MDAPKLPCSTLPPHTTNCFAIGASRPYNARKRPTSSCVAPGGSIIAIGSPGTTRTSTNTTTATPNKVGSAQKQALQEITTGH